MVWQAIGSRALRNLVTPVKVGILVVLGLVAFFVFLSFIQDEGMKGETKEYSAVFADASGLAPKTPVRVAGIPVGQIDRITLESGKARVFFLVRSDIPVYPNATLSKRSASILGDFVLDLNPGSPAPVPQQRQVEPTGSDLWTPKRFRVVPASYRLAQATAPQGPPPNQPLPSGSEIENVQEAPQLDKLIESLSQITGDVKAITSSLRETLAGPDNSVQRIVENLDRVSSRLDQTLATSSEQLQRILANTEAVTAEVRGITERKGEDVEQIITNVRLITEQTRGILASVESVVGGQEGELQETVGGIKDSLANLNKSLANIESITAKIDNGEGALGKLVSDKELGDKLADAVYDASDYVSRLSALRAEVTLRSEYLFEEEGAKNYLQLRLIPAPDKYFLFEVVDDPRGFVSRETVLRSPPGSEEVANQEVRIIRDTLKFSVEFAKRFFFATFRFGLIESTGGVGLDLHFLEDSLAFKLDVFEFANPDKDYPRFKAYVNYMFLSHLFVSGGLDDAFNGAVLEPTTGQTISGRDWFLGGGVYFTDQDIKSILGAVGGSIGIR